MGPQPPDLDAVAVDETVDKGQDLAHGGLPGFDGPGSRNRCASVASTR